MHTYTFIMEFRGGTYISQVNADTIEEGMINWCKDLKVDEIKYFGKKTIENILSVIEDEIPTPIDTVKNVWLFCLRIKVGFLFVNVVKTDVN